MGRIFFGWLILAIAIGVGASAEAATTLVTGFFREPMARRRKGHC